MFCINCGAKLTEGMKFCNQCGTPVARTAAAKPSEPIVAQELAGEYPSAQYAAAVPIKTSHTKRNVLIALAVLLVLAGGIFAALMATGVIELGRGVSLERAQAYLDDKDYDKATAAFKELLDEDPDNAECYLGLAAAYIGSEDIDKAVEVLEDALEKLEDEDDIEKAEEVLEELYEQLYSQEGILPKPAQTTGVLTPDEPRPVISEYGLSVFMGKWGADTMTDGTVTQETWLNMTMDDEKVYVDNEGVIISRQLEDIELRTGGFTFFEGDAVYSFDYNEDDTIVCYVTVGNSYQRYLLTRGYADKDISQLETIETIETTETGMGSTGDEGDVLNIYVWNNEFQQMVENYYPGYTPYNDDTGYIGDVRVNWIVVSTVDGEYQKELDRALLYQDSADVDEKVDIFLIETDYADKYVLSDYTLPLSELGITDDVTYDMYPYTKQVGSDDSGVLKAVSWHITPGMFAYRRSFAKEVLGTDDPAEVQKFVRTWEDFCTTANKMGENGYKMLAGYYDAYRVFAQNMSRPWVDDGFELTVNDEILTWINMTKDLADKKFIGDEWLWSDEWCAGMGGYNNVFGYFVPTWMVDFVMPMNAGDTYGDWAVCAGPDAFNWGGSYICAGYQTDNASLVADIMYQLCCNPDIMRTFTADMHDTANNITVIQEMVQSDYTSDYLGGQNPFSVYHEAAKNIDFTNVNTYYDMLLSDFISAAMRDYFDGKSTLEQALTVFFEDAFNCFPELIVPQ